ncbi:hypothetical protein [Candidatus Cyanaurora vandensis]|uniref:hypothetical protein n=1 Tax=Candidatus Cyanaurora vandensis TaxID=2714958 RepID=UPI00257F6CE2|nr:hypothetical protein [Candidatus Cyanaurora vandensis]
MAYLELPSELIELLQHRAAARGKSIADYLTGLTQTDKPPGLLQNVVSGLGLEHLTLGEYEAREGLPEEPTETKI